jgi:hypothetical protein
VAFFTLTTAHLTTITTLTTLSDGPPDPGADQRPPDDAGSDQPDQPKVDDPGPDPRDGAAPDVHEYGIEKWKRASNNAIMQLFAAAMTSLDKR